MRAELARAQAELRDFEERNRAWKLDSQINHQLTLVNNLRQSAVGNTVGGRTTERSRAELQALEDGLLAEIKDLRDLQLEYDRLNFEVTIATAALANLTNREGEFALTGEVTITQRLRNEIDTARQRVSRAQTARDDYLRRHGISDPSTEIALRLSHLSELRRQRLTGSTTAEGLESILAAENAELDRLMRLSAEQTELAARVAQAASEINSLQSYKLQLTIAGTLLPASQVKIIDAAQPQSNLLWTLVLYAVGTLLGLVAGLIVVYLTAYFDRTPRTEAEVEALVGVPVLARVPPA